MVVTCAMVLCVPFTLASKSQNARIRMQPPENNKKNKDERTNKGGNDQHAKGNFRLLSVFLSVFFAWCSFA